MVAGSEIGFSYDEGMKIYKYIDDSQCIIPQIFADFNEYHLILKVYILNHNSMASDPLVC